MELSPSRAFWAGGNPTRHPGYLEELRGQPGSSRRLRPGCTRLAQPIGSIAPADSLPAGLGRCRGGGRGRSEDAQRVSCARIRQKATLPRPPARPSGRYDETGSAAFCTSTCRSHDVTGFQNRTHRPHPDLRRTAPTGRPCPVRRPLNGGRPHRALSLLPPRRPDHPAPDLDHRRIRRRSVLGGLINEYERAA
jgi:hypothetical protein